MRVNSPNSGSGAPGADGWSSAVDKSSSSGSLRPSTTTADNAAGGLRERRPPASAGSRSAVAPRGAVLPSIRPAIPETSPKDVALPLRRGADLPTFESKTASQPEQRLKANEDLREKLDAGMFPYQRIAKGNYQPSDALASAVADKVWSAEERVSRPGQKGLLPSSQIERPAGTLVDNSSGHVASLLVNHKTEDIAAVFGGTTAGRVAGPPLRLALGNAEMAIPQWTANARTALGLPTKSHDQAQRVVGAIKELQQTPEFSHLAHYSVSTMGHSKGGGEAASSGIANYSLAAPVTVTGLSSAPLNKSQLRDYAKLGIDVADAEQHINVYSVKLDVVPNLGHLMRGVGATVVGTEHFFSGGLADPLTRHVMSDQLIRAQLTKQDDAIKNAAAG
ncbi:hypothetical protein [Mitsuaria sp. 7]|uniref:hypothetical protein n=1 Tax=Mitsuaria sp. 7 TaxID=1658665 RepID=UPI0007DCC0E8|nr:hypothetical protein [Mitsuaria sp. 7]ANH69152.1 hypothetical protein ABE85_19140 [Mitsuaria sp. 7]